MDERVVNSIRKLSTGDLVTAYGILDDSYKWALRRGDMAVAGELLARLRACDGELADRQLTIDDELQLLRRSNQTSSS